MNRERIVAPVACAFLGVVALGCGSGVATEARTAAALEAKSGSQCELILNVSSYVKKKTAAFSSGDVCIKHAESPIEIPSQIQLELLGGDGKVDEAKQLGRASWRKYCQEGTQRRDKSGDSAGAGAKPTKANSPSPISDDANGPEVCIWNGQYRDDNPIRIEIKVSDPGKDIRDFVGRAVILRNGRSVYRWVPADVAANGTTAIVVDNQLVTQPEFFWEPVELDLYVLGTGADKTAADAAEKYAQSKFDLRERLGGALRAAAVAMAPSEIRDAAGCYEQKLKYIKAVVDQDDTAKKSASEKIEELAKKTASFNERWDAQEKDVTRAVVYKATNVGDKTVLPKAPAGGVKLALIVAPNATRTGHNAALSRWTGSEWKNWEASDSAEPKKLPFVIADVEREGVKYDITLGGADTLDADKVYSRRFECSSPEADLKGWTGLGKAEWRKLASGALTGRTAQSTEEVDAQIKGIEAALAKAGDELTLTVDRLPTEYKEIVQKSVYWAKVVGLSGAALDKTAKEFVANAANQKRAIVDTLKDPAAQNRAYQGFASGLPTDQTLYSKAQHNPESGVGEARLRMSYVDPSQYYWLLAWNALPVPILSASHVSVEPRAENLIPIVDIWGMHRQTGLGKFKIAPATYGLGVGVLAVRETISPPGGVSYVTGLNPGIQANVSIGAVRVGVAEIIREEDSTGHFISWRNMRVLIGADLLRFFGGGDAAVSTAAASGTEGKGDVD